LLRLVRMRLGGAPPPQPSRRRRRRRRPPPRARRGRRGVSAETFVDQLLPPLRLGDTRDPDRLLAHIAGLRQQLATARRLLIAQEQEFDRTLNAYARSSAATARELDAVRAELDAVKATARQLAKGAQ